MKVKNNCSNLSSTGGPLEISELDNTALYCIVSSFIITHSWQNAAIYSIRIKDN